MNMALAERLENGRPPVRETRKPVVLRPGERATPQSASEDHLFRNARGESFWYRIVAEGEACLTGYSSDRAHVVVPERIGGYAIVSLDSGSFADLPQLETLACPRGLRSIEDYAFSRCAHLNEIQLNEGLESIGHTAFYLCNRLASVRVPDSVRHIGNSPFGESLRGHVARLQTLEISPGNAYLHLDGAGALYERCGEGRWRLVDASGVNAADYEPLAGTVEVGESAFLGNLSLERFRGNAGLARIDRDAFRACSHLAEVELPVSLESIGTGAFSCAGVRCLRIPARCVSLEPDALCTGPVFRGSTGRPYASTLEAIEADDANPAFCSREGALFTRGADGHPDELLLCPREATRLDLSGICRTAPAAFAGAERVGELVVEEKLAGFAPGSVHFSCERLRVRFSSGGERDGAREAELLLPSGKAGSALVSRLFAGDVSGESAPALAVDAFLAAYDSALAELMAGSDAAKIEAARLIARRCASPAGLSGVREAAFRAFLSANIASVCAHFGARGDWEGLDDLAAAGMLGACNARQIADALARCCGSLAVAHVLQLERAGREREAREVPGQPPVTLASRIGDAYAL